jgi:hypothetical protein
MKNEIKPNTKLTSISITKLNDTACWRYYYWKYIRNLEPKGINLNFWYGGVLGAGMEQMLLTGKYSRSKTETVMNKEDKARRVGYDIKKKDKDEMSLQRRLITEILRGVQFRDFFRDLRLNQNQIQVEYEIMPGIKFIGYIDGMGTYRRVPCTTEIKGFKRVQNNLFGTLSYDKQIYSYPIGLKARRLEYPRKCIYIILRKSQKKIKKGQTPDDFVEEIREDLIKRPEFYYIHYPITLGKDTINRVKTDIYRQTEILKMLYDSMTEKEILDPFKWPQRDKQCTAYSGCPYMLLCRYPERYKTYLGLFQERKFRGVDDEGDE